MPVCEVRQVEHLAPPVLALENRNYGKGDPAEMWYRFNGRTLGYVGNNGTQDTSYQASVESRTRTQGTGVFAGGSAYGAAYADFDQSVAPELRRQRARRAARRDRADRRGIGGGGIARTRLGGGPSSGASLATVDRSSAGDLANYSAPVADLAAGAGGQLQRIVNRQRYREARVAEALAAEQVSPSPSRSPGGNNGDGRDSRPSVLTTEGMFGSSASVQRNKAMYREAFDRKPGYYNVQDYGIAMANYDYWYDRISKIEARVDTQIDREMGGIILTGPVGGALGTGIVLAAPAVQGFVYANALRISVAGDLTADFFTGTQVSVHIPATIGGATASLAVAERAVLGEANFAQKSFKATLSEEGAFAGRRVSDVAGDIRTGPISPSDVVLDYIVREGKPIILNTRSAQALEQAGVPRGQWNGVNRTGDSFFEELLSGQLSRNKLGSQGTPTVRPGSGRH